MSLNKSNNKFKIIQMQDIVATILALTIFLISISAVFGSTFYRQSTPNNLSKRNLAMFSSIVYANLEDISNYNIKMDRDINNLTFSPTSMVSDNQLKSINSDTNLLGIINLSGETENTYKYLFYDLASTSEVKNWQILNYCKVKTVEPSLDNCAEFSAMTFKNDNNIVISYRGTDFEDVGDWTQDICYGLIGATGQEDEAQKYALTVAKKYPNSNIYITGHSLGGFLAQIGGASLLNSKYKNNVKEITYFNGMGLLFFSNLEKNSTAISTFKNVLNKNNINLDKLKDDTIQREAATTLTNWHKSGGNLNLYRINGDLVSALGTHYGNIKGFDAYNKCIEHHKNKQYTLMIKDKDFTTTLNKLGNGSSLFLTLNNIFNNPVYKYPNKYGANNILQYVWMTHETDSFFGVLPSEPEIKILLPPSVKYKNTVTGTLTVITKNNETLQNTSLNTSILIVSHPNRIAITGISEPTIKNVGTNTIYTYNIYIKGKLVIGNSTISLKNNTFICSLNNEQVGNNFTTSNIIKTTLR